MCSEARGRERRAYDPISTVLHSGNFLFALTSFQRMAAVSFRAKLTFAASPSLLGNALTKERGLWLGGRSRSDWIISTDKGDSCTLYTA